MSLVLVRAPFFLVLVLLVLVVLVFVLAFLLLVVLMPMLMTLLPPVAAAAVAVALAATAARLPLFLSLVSLVIGCSISSQPCVSLPIEHFTVLHAHEDIMVLDCMLLFLLLPYPGLELIERFSAASRLPRLDLLGDGRPTCSRRWPPRLSGRQEGCASSTLALAAHELQQIATAVARAQFQSLHTHSDRTRGRAKKS